MPQSPAPRQIHQIDNQYSSPTARTQHARESLPSAYPSSKTRPHLSGPRTSQCTVPFAPRLLLSTGAVGTNQPISLPNAVQNLQRLINKSTTNLAAVSHTQQHSSARNAGGLAGTYTPPLRQTASTPMLFPPVNGAPFSVSSHTPTVGAAIKKDPSEAGQEIHRTSNDVPVKHLTAIGALSGPEILVHNISVESFRHDPILNEALVIKEAKEQKETKEEKEKRRAERKARKESKEETPEEKTNRRAERKAKKEVKGKGEAEKDEKAKIEQEPVLSSVFCLDLPPHQERACTRSTSHWENRDLAPGSQSVEIMPSCHPPTPRSLTDTVRTSSSPPLDHQMHPMSILSPAQASPATLAPPTMPTVRPTKSSLDDRSGHKTHKLDELAHTKPIDGFQERRTNAYKIETLTSGSDSSAKAVAATIYASQPPSLSIRPPPQHQLAQSHSTAPRPQVMIMQQPPPPSHYPPNPLNDYSYSRVSMSYEPQHRHSTDLRTHSNPCVKPTAKQGSYTYLPLGQKDVVTAYSHDYGKQTPRAPHTFEEVEYVEVEDERDGCCSCLFWARDKEYHRYEKPKVGGKKGKEPRLQMDDEDEDDGCVVM